VCIIVHNDATEKEYDIENNKFNKIKIIPTGETESLYFDCNNIGITGYDCKKSCSTFKPMLYDIMFEALLKNKDGSKNYIAYFLYFNDVSKIESYDINNIYNKQLYNITENESHFIYILYDKNKEISSSGSVGRNPNFVSTFFNKIKESQNENNLTYNENALKFDKHSLNREFHHFAFSNKANAIEMTLMGFPDETQGASANPLLLS
jgi:hypothetical protein